MKTKYHVAIGSRKLKESIIPVKQPFTRRIASWGFSVYVRLLFNLPFKDTQLGAKAFTRQAALAIVNHVKTNGWAFDTDVIWTLYRMGYRIKEVPIIWRDDKNSNLRLFQAIRTMFVSMLKLKFRRSQTWKQPSTSPEYASKLK